MTDYQVSIGDVLHLLCSHCEPQKPKFFVVVSVEPKPVLLIINSERNNFVKNSKKIKQCHISIKQETHKFLKYDSWVDCCEHHEIDLEDIERDMKYGGKLCGKLSNEAVKDISNGVKSSPVLERRKKRQILESLYSLIRGI